MGSSYTFGESAIASRRLALLSEVFDATSKNFLRDTVPFRPRLAFDLGCGPGHTTRLIANTLEPLRTIGIERSKAFLLEARAMDPENISFVEGDVTDTPLPAANPDLIYARFLLSHLPRPEKVVESWVGQLLPGGVLLLEEVEKSRTTRPVLKRYLEIVSSILAHYGNELYIGSRLGVMSEDARVYVGSSQVTQVEPTTGQAASMFSMNLATLRDDEFIRDSYSRREIEDVEKGLLRLTGSRPSGEIVWSLRQIVIERT